MVRKKRKYVPKVKGCYECSQRRIDCDGTKPSCAKCSTRGIPCSGFGLTYKFLDGFSSRRKSSSSVNRSALLKDALAQSSSDASFRVRPNKTQRDVENDNTSYDDWDTLYWETSMSFLDFDDAVQQAALVDACWQSSPFINDISSSCDGVENEEGQIQSQTTEVPRVPIDSGELNEVDEEVFSTSTTEALDYRAVLRSVTPMDLSLLEPWKEFLLTHFSEAIAPQMVVVDDCFNGWRHLILPLAWSSDMVMDAVMAVSAFHISGIISVQSVANPDRLYSRAIKQLLNRKDLADWDGETKQMVILAIVVLLVSVMVNGLRDFPIVFQMLESAIEAVGGEDILADGGEMGGFLLRQIRKMRVYAAPLLSQDAGINAIMYHARESFDCLYYYHSLYPDCCSTFDLLADLRQQAFNIYLNRVLTDRNRASSDELILSYQKSLESFPEGAFGEHVLVWSTFIAALECRNREQQSFFEQFLLRQYRRNKFMNILRALELLRKVWSQTACGGETNWPALIPDMRVFIM